MIGMDIQIAFILAFELLLSMCSVSRLRLRLFVVCCA